MAYAIRTTKQFDKNYKLCVKRGYDMRLIQEAMTLLRDTGTLPAHYKPHVLHADRKGQWECHIKPDRLLIWEQNDTELTLLFLQTGTHADLF